jgi:uncharacterized membrane protein
MNKEWVEFCLLIGVPFVVAFALPKIMRRSVSFISIVIFVISLFGTGVHDTFFHLYVANVIVLVGSIVREFVNLVVRTFRFAYRS